MGLSDLSPQFKQANVFASDLAHLSADDLVQMGFGWRDRQRFLTGRQSAEVNQSAVSKARHEGTTAEYPPPAIQASSLGPQDAVVTVVVSGPLPAGVEWDREDIISPVHWTQ